MATLYLQAKIDSTDYGDVGNGGVTSSFLRLVSFGAYASGGAHYDIREIKVGTTAYGSSDLFAPALTGLGDFDGIFGNDGSIVVSGGLLSVDDDSSNDHYGWKDLGSDITPDLYVQFQVRTRTGDGTPDYQDVWDDSTEASTDGANVDGIFSPAGAWHWNGPGNIFGSGAILDTWVTVNLHYSFIAPPPPPSPFHIAS